MDHLLTSWLLIASVNIAATMSPGPAFAMTVRNAIAYDRRTGIFTAIGLGAGVAVLVFSALFGFAVLIAQSVFLFNLVKYAGAAYLIFIGVKALKAKKHAAATTLEQPDAALAEKSLSALAALRCGFITNLLNVKGMVFFSSVYVQFITPDMPLPVIILYGMTAVIIEILWFSLVSLILTDRRIKRRFLGFSYWIERVCGGLLIALGVRLALSKG